jgi:hypothetical protein
MRTQFLYTCRCIHHGGVYSTIRLDWEEGNAFELESAQAAWVRFAEVVRIEVVCGIWVIGIAANINIAVLPDFITLPPKLFEDKFEILEGWNEHDGRRGKWEAPSSSSVDFPRPAVVPPSPSPRMAAS